ncbi:MAG TPA: serine hydrolase [Kofleriaceae bacterium]|nr:serine hydrolase [Kofleriaceae bacterium]
MAVCLVIAACGEPAAKPTPKAPVAAPATAPVEAAPEPVALPDTAAGKQLAWILAAINEPENKPTDADLKAHFNDRFLAAVPVAKMHAVIDGLAAIGPLVVTEIDLQSSATSMVVSATAAGKAFKISIAVEQAPPHKIASLFFANQVEPRSDIHSVDELIAAVDAEAARAGIYMARIENGRCQDVVADDAGEMFALGSAFKLYVLSALVQAVEDGRVRWDQPVTIRDDWKSLPSGTTQNVAAGTKMTVRALAEKMISISDNTATDHLIHTLGRKRIEAAVVRSGHPEPARMKPFSTTRELFILRAAPADEVARYAKMPVAKKRAFLDKVIDKRPLPDLKSLLSAWTKPRDIDTVEWFASGKGLCQLMAGFQAHRDEPAYKPALEILAKNPGVELPPEIWPYIGFKGGSEPGVLTLNWLLRRKDGGWYFLSLLYNDGDKVIGPGAISLAPAAARLLAGVPPSSPAH